MARVPIQSLRRRVVLCRFKPLLPLYGALSTITGAVPTSVGQIGFMATDGSRVPPVSTTATCGTNATNSNTNVSNDD